MELRPKQQPHPPFWYAGNPVKAAQRGMNFIGGGSIRGISKATALYKETLAKARASSSVSAMKRSMPR